MVVTPPAPLDFLNGSAMLGSVPVSGRVANADHVVEARAISRFRPLQRGPHVCVVDVRTAPRRRHCGRRVSSGTVTDSSGKPLVGICVAVRGPFVTGKTDGSGKFTVATPTPGDYFVDYADCSGTNFLPATYQAPGDSSPTTIHVTDTSVITGIDAALTLGGDLRDRERRHRSAGQRRVCLPVQATRQHGSNRGHRTIRLPQHLAWHRDGGVRRLQRDRPRTRVVPAHGFRGNGHPDHHRLRNEGARNRRHARPDGRDRGDGHRQRRQARPPASA